jgi:hypothetical protein
MHQSTLNLKNKGAVVLNPAARCRVCGRSLSVEPWVSLRIGPQCAYRSGEHAGLVKMLRQTRNTGGSEVIDEPDPVAALGKIGMSPEQIMRVDIPRLAMRVGEMGAAVKQMTAFDRLAKKGAAPGRASSCSRQGIECFDSAIMRWYNSGPEPTVTLKSTAGVICCALQASAFGSSAFVELGEDEVNRAEATLFRSSLTDTLVESRLYGQMVKAKRAALRADQGQYMLSFLDAGNCTMNGSDRPEINYAGMTHEVIKEASEGNRRAGSIFCSIEKHLGEDTCLESIHWLDDLNVRGAQVGALWNMVVGKEARRDQSSVMVFMESLYSVSDQIDRLNESTRKDGIKHVAVVGGAQMGHRPVVKEERLNVREKGRLTEPSLEVDPPVLSCAIR